MPNLSLCHWSSQLFDLRVPSSTDVPVLLLNQSIYFQLARTSTTLTRLVHAQKCVASSKDSTCDLGRNQQRKALYAATFDSSPKSLFSLKERSSRQILKTMELQALVRKWGVSENELFYG